jgi:choline dehydrogenase-like flavoprotein
MTRSRHNTLTYDVVVVGSGASGSVASKVLTDRGFSVLCIEKGDYVSDQHATHEFGWEAQKRKQFNSNPNIRQNPADYSIDCSESPIDVANYNGVGGSTVLFSGHYPRFHPSDFKVWSVDGVGRDWPFSYEDLQPFYKANEEFLEVAGLAGDPAYPDLMDHLKAPIPLGLAGKSLADGLNRLGWHWWPSYSAIKTESSALSERNTCRNIGPCNVGCPIGAKSSADITFLKEALSRGLVFLTNTTALSVVLSRKGDVAGLICKESQGKSFEIKTKNIMLCGNALGTLRILSDSSQSSGYIGNSSGQVGKNFMIHPLGYVEGVLPTESDTHVGPQGSWLASHEFYESDRNRGFVRGYSLHFLRSRGPIELSLNAILRKKLCVGPNFLTGLKSRLRSSVGIGIICEDLPEESNFVEILHDQPFEADGLPKLKVHYEMSQNSTLMMKHGMARARELLQAIGASEIYGSGPVRFAGWHLTGTTRMGLDPADSVVDPGGQFHDIPGLYALDGGVFPTSAGVNPAATIQAVAHKIASEFDHAR